MAMSELVFAVDEFDQPVQPVTRSRAIREGIWRRASGILITSPDYSQVLCHKRTETKDERPGLWVSMFGGKSDPGEVPSQTALRELREEAGIILDEQPRFFGKAKSAARRQFEYLHWAPWSGDIATLTYDPEEVQMMRWLEAGEVHRNLSENTLGWYCYSSEELALIGHVMLLAS